MSYLRLSVLILGLAGLGGCATESHMPVVQEFGRAVREDVAAQIADPDALLRPSPPPVGDGARVGLAQERYRTGRVIAPATASASTVGAAATPESPAPAPAAAPNTP